MSIIFVPGDEYVEILHYSLDAVTLVKYYNDSDCTVGSSKFRGKYRKITKYIINPPSNGIKKGMFDTWFVEKVQDNNFNDIDLIFDFISESIAIFSSEKIEENPYYNLEYWKKEYNERGEAIAQIERETGHHVW